MIPKEIIVKAIEGGWNVGDRLAIEFWLPKDFAEIALDPTFWQALGKALGWKGDFGIQIGYVFCQKVLWGQSTDEFWKELGV